MVGDSGFIQKICVRRIGTNSKEYWIGSTLGIQAVFL